MSDLSSHDFQAAAAARPSVDLSALMELDDATFIGAAYQSLLRRPADVDGLVHYLRKLRAGSTKIEVLHALSRSREGRSNGASLRGLDRALRRHRLLRSPVLGGLLRWLTDAEGYSAEHRRQRAIEQVLLRQLADSQRQHAELLEHLAAIRPTAGPIATAPSVQAEVPRSELVVQHDGQTPSMLSSFIQLRRTPPKGVMAQLREMVAGSREAELLAVGRRG